MSWTGHLLTRTRTPPPATNQSANLSNGSHFHHSKGCLFTGQQAHRLTLTPRAQSVKRERERERERERDRQTETDRQMGEEEAKKTERGKDRETDRPTERERERERERESHIGLCACVCACVCVCGDLAAAVLLEAARLLPGLVRFARRRRRRVLQMKLGVTRGTFDDKNIIRWRHAPDLSGGPGAYNVSARWK